MAVNHPTVNSPRPLTTSSASEPRPLQGWQPPRRRPHIRHRASHWYVQFRPGSAPNDTRFGLLGRHYTRTHARRSSSSSVTRDDPLRFHRGRCSRVIPKIPGPLRLNGRRPPCVVLPRSTDIESPVAPESVVLPGVSVKRAIPTPRRPRKRIIERSSRPPRRRRRARAGSRASYAHAWATVTRERMTTLRKHHRNVHHPPRS